MTSTGKLAFYILSAIMVVTSLAVLAANTDLLGEGDVVRNFAKWGLVAVLGEIAGLFTLVVKAAIKPRSFTLVVGLPHELRRLDVRRVSWEPDKCVAYYARRTKNLKVQPVLSAAGPAFEIRLPAEIFEEADDAATVELELVDKNGLRWEVRPFFVFYRHDALLSREPLANVATTYGLAL